MANLAVMTAKGNFEIELLFSQAPHTCEYFLNLAKTSQLNNFSVFRIVSQRNDPESFPINVIQIGSRTGLLEETKLIMHESTNITGLSHQKWSVSAARFQPGVLYKSFFVCMADEPELDFGGKRNEDGQGFAKFGHVIKGHDVVESIFACSESQEFLSKPISVVSISQANS